MISNILQPTSGKVWVRGSIAPLIELGAGFDHDLSVADNIILYGVMLGFSEAEMRWRSKSILEFAELEDYTSAPVKSLSSGMSARLGFAIATDVQPDILILDEVLSVGDQSFRNKCKQRIDRFWNTNTTVLLVSHDISSLRKSCQRVIWVDRGKIRMVGEATDVIKAYLQTVSPEDDLLKELEADEAAMLAEISLANQIEEEPDPEPEEPAAEEIEEEVVEPELPIAEWVIAPDEHSGKVTLSRIFIADEHKQPIQQVEFGKPFYVGLEYRVDEAVRDLRVGFCIQNEAGNILVEANTWNYLSPTGIVCHLGHHLIWAKIPAPLLIPGRYFIGYVGAYEEFVGHHHSLLKQLMAFDVLPIKVIPSAENRNQEIWFGGSLTFPPIEVSVD